MAKSILPVGVQAVARGVGEYVRSLSRMNRAVTEHGRAVERAARSYAGFNAAVNRASSRGAGRLAQDLSRTVTAAGGVQRMLTGLSANVNTHGTAVTALASQYRGLGQAISGVAAGRAGLPGLGTALAGAGQGLSGLRAGLGQSLSVLGLFGGALRGIATVAGGILAADVFRGIRDQIAGLRNEITGAVADFQTLDIQLQGLLAREIKNTQGVKSMTDAFVLAIPKAQELRDWIVQIAVTTPFEASDVASVLSLSMAMGFTAQEAKSLTLAIGEYTAFMGLSGEVMERIILNFGQMRAAGKVTGTELRDLARGAFLPVNDILRRMGQEMGVAENQMESFIQRAREGEVDVNRFFAAFVDMVKEDMAGSMTRMSRTVRGVISNFRDFFKTVIGVETLGPLFQRFTDLAAGALDSLMSPAVRRAAILIGETLGVAFDRVIGPVRAFVGSIRSLAQALGIVPPNITTVAGAIALLSRALAKGIQALADFVNAVAARLKNGLLAAAQSVFSYGANIAVQLAKGLIQGAATAIVAAMNYISRLLTSWLAPGSPPKVAPKIDVWGAQAMTEYLRGFTLADFSVIESVGGMIGRALSTLVDIGHLAPDLEGGVFARMQMDLTRLLDQFTKTGTVNEDLIRSITKSTGLFGGEIGKLIRQQLNLASAVKRVEEAELRLKRAQEDFTAADNRVARLTREYNQLLRAGADKSVLDAKLREINAAEKAREVAAAQTVQAEEDLKGAKEKAQVLQEQAQLQEKLLQQLLAFVEAQKKLREEEEKLPEGGGAGGGDFEPGGGVEIPQLEMPGGISGIGQNIRENIDKILAEAEAQIKAKLLEIWEQIKAFFKDLLGPVLEPLAEAWGRLVEAAQPAISRLREIWQQFLANWPGIWAEIQRIASETWQFIVEKANQARPYLEMAWQIISQAAIWAWDLIKKAVGTAAEIIGSEIGKIIELIRNLNINWDLLAQVGKIAFGILVGAVVAFIAVVAGLVTVVTGIITGIVRGFRTLMEAGVQYTTATWNALKGFVEGVATMLQGWWMTLQGLFTGNWDMLVQGWRTTLEGIWAILHNGVTAIVLIVSGGLVQITAFVSGFVSGIIEFFTNLYNKIVGHSIIPDMMNKMKEVILTGLNAIRDFFFNIWNGILSFLSGVVDTLNARIADWIANARTTIQNGWNAIQTIITSVWNAIRTATASAISALRSAIQTWITNAKSTIQNGWNAIQTIITSVWNAIKSGVSSAAAAVVSTVQGLVNRIKSAFNFNWSSIGSSIVSGIARGISSGAGSIISAARNAAQSAFNAAKKKLGISSPSKVFEDLFEEVPAGAAKGIKNTTSMMVAAMTAATKKLQDTGRLRLMETQTALASERSAGQMAMSAQSVAAPAAATNVNINFGTVNFGTAGPAAFNDLVRIIRDTVRSEVGRR